MYFDLSPRSRAPRHRPQSPRSASATSTTTLLPFRRSGHAVDVALSPVQEYTQPQWSLPHSPEPLWSPHRVPPPPTPSSAAATSPVRESFVQQQQQRTGAWAGTAPPHAYCVGGYVDLSDGLRPPARSPYRESEAPVYYTAPSSHNGGETAAAALPRQPFAASPMDGTAAAAAVAASSTPQRRDAVLSGDRRRQLNGGAAAAPSPVSRPRGRGITEVRPGCTTSTERVRYRNNVTKKLIDLYDEVAELYECRDNMNFQVTQAMRSDPRYTKERHGEVRLAYKPTPAQQAAMTGVDTALEALHDACHELVACYLTPEEKRYLGIDTHLFQTHAERSTTYQYAPPSAKDKVKKALQPPAPPGGAGVASSRASSTTSSTRRHHRTRESGEVAQQQPQQQQTPMRDDRFTSQATSLPSAAMPPPPVLSPSPSPIAEERTASTVRMPSPSPPLAAAAAAPLAFSPPARQAFAASPAPEDTAAEGSASSPERLYARAASTSSLGGGGWPSDTASATVRAASAVAAPQSPVMTKTAVAAPGGATMRGPQGQLLVKVPVQPPHSPTLKLPPGIPPGAKLVKMPMSVSPTSTAPSGAFPPPPAAAAAAVALPSSNPPSRPPSRTNSAINRTTATAPKAPATRAEFMKFLIDSDSDSTA